WSYLARGTHSDQRKKHQPWGCRRLRTLDIASSGLQIVALLVLLAGAAEARVVAPDLLAGRRARHGLGPGCRRGGAGGLAGDLAAGLARVGKGRHRRQPHRRIADDLHLEEPLDDGPLHALEHVLEEIERFLLILGQWVALTIPTQADTLFEVVDREQMVLPLRVEDEEHLVA